MRDTPAMLRELNVVEQRYQAVLQVLDGISVTEVAERFGVARQTVHRWMARYRDSGLDGNRLPAGVGARGDHDRRPEDPGRPRPRPQDRRGHRGSRYLPDHRR